MGLSVQLVMEGVQLAGQLAGTQLGFSLAAIIDPQTNIETPALNIFYQMIAMLIFLQLNVHHWMIRAVVKSFDYLARGNGSQHADWDAGAFSRGGGHVADRRADGRADPAGHDGCGRHDRVSQQGFAPTSRRCLMGISAKSLIGYMVLAASAALWPGILERQFTNALGWTERLLHLAT